MYNVVIIGAGSIGALKDDDYDSPKTENILTHAHAVKEHTKFNLFAICDTDFEKVKKAAKKWSCGGFSEIGICEFTKKIDIAVIATPTETHIDVYEKIREWPNLKAIIIEKPCTDELMYAEGIADLETERNRVIVNYTRRFIPEYKVIRNNLEQQKVLSCVIHYVRGIKRDSCHAINLMNYFFGEMEDIKFISKGQADYSENDTSDCFWMKMERCPNVLFIPGDGRIADHFDIEIMTQNGMICLFDHGSSIYTREVATEKVYGDYQSLQGYGNTFIKINFRKRLLMNLYDSIFKFIKEDENPCPISEAVTVHEIIKELKASEKEQKLI